MEEHPKTKTWRPKGTYLGAVEVPMNVEEIDREDYLNLLAQRIQRLVDEKTLRTVYYLLSVYRVDEIIGPKDKKGFGIAIMNVVRIRGLIDEVTRLFSKRGRIRVKLNPKWQDTLEEESLEEYLGHLDYRTYPPSYEGMGIDGLDEPEAVEGPVGASVGSRSQVTRDIKEKSIYEITGEELASLWDIIEAEEKAKVSQPKESTPATSSASNTLPLNEHEQKVDVAVQAVIDACKEINEILGE